MSFDCSRFTFNAWDDFLGVVMQQGRVQLDADWNEFVTQLIRRIQAGTLDTFEQTVVPRVTPDGFRIDFKDGELSIGVGRIYVDGILAENHGAVPLKWDPQLAEMIGSTAINYADQPYYPSPPALTEIGKGTYLVYLDVWQREVSYLQHPALVEKAVGVDTTARLQTVWQVKVLPIEPKNTRSVQCDTPDADVPGWNAVIRPSAARMTTATGSVAASPNPCLIPPTGGYRGLENQLYRVEIHDEGTFKWSRDNGTVQSWVSQINAARDRIIVDSVGHDALLRFSDGDWVEITDDVRELHGLPGEMRRIKLGGGVDDATRTIVLDKALLPADIFPTGEQDKTDPARHTRIRRWDQSGRVLRADGSLYHDLDAPGSNGLIPVPSAGTALFLENGIQVQFDLDPNVIDGSFHVGDHWTFAARAIDASIEELHKAPPHGTHHHYARLAVVTLPSNKVSDCRVLWPPEEENCACDACVTAKSHAAGTGTIQQAIERLAKKGGGVICLGAGTYSLQEPLHIKDICSIHIRGKGWRTVLAPERPGPAIHIQDSIGVILEDFAIVGTTERKRSGQGLITTNNTVKLHLDRLYLLAPPSGASIGVKFDGCLLGASMRQCAVVADIGITGGIEKEGQLLTANLSISDNLLVCSHTGLELGKRSLHYGDTCFARNLIQSSRQAAIMVQGGTLPGSSFRIDANSLFVSGDGIVAAVGTLRITDNVIRGSLRGKEGNSNNGVVLTGGLDPSGIDQVWITGNQLTELLGAGIEVRTPLGSAIIKQNVIERTRSGVRFVDEGASSHLSIENNQLLRIAEQFEEKDMSMSEVGIQVLAAREVDIVGNILSNFAEKASNASNCVAIRVAFSGDIRVSGNRLSEIGSKQMRRNAGYVAGIEIQPPYTRATLSENFISNSPVAGREGLQWQGIRILHPNEIGFFSAANAIIIPTKNDIYLLTRTWLKVLSSAQSESLLIRGNQCVASAIASQLVIVASPGPASCIFSENHFESTMAKKVSGNALVELNAKTVIASNNRLRWIDSDLAALDVVADDKGFTVIGNITMGRITIKGVALQTPWAELNVIAS